MDNANMQIIAALLGALVAGLIGVGLYFLQQWNNRRTLRNAFIDVIKDDLANSVNFYQQLKDTGETQRFISFEIITGLRKSRTIFDKYMEHLILIKPIDLRKRIFNYYLQSSVLVDRLESYQNRIYVIENNFNEAIKLFKKSNPNATSDEINKNLLNEHNMELSQYDFFKQDTLRQLRNLDSLKIEAQLLLDRLS